MPLFYIKFCLFCFFGFYIRNFDFHSFPPSAHFHYTNTSFFCKRISGNRSENKDKQHMQKTQRLSTAFFHLQLFCCFLFIFFCVFCIRIFFFFVVALLFDLFAVICNPLHYFVLKNSLFYHILSV